MAKRSTNSEALVRVSQARIEKGLNCDNERHVDGLVRLCIADRWRLKQIC